MPKHQRNTPPVPSTPVDWDSVTFTVTINKEPKQVPDTDADPFPVFEDYKNDETGHFLYKDEATGEQGWFEKDSPDVPADWVLQKRQVGEEYPKRDSHGTLTNAFYTEVDADGNVIPRDSSQPYVMPFGADVVRKRAAASADYAAKYAAVIAAIRDLANVDYPFED